MILAIPVDEKSCDSAVCVSFGRTPYFLIYDTDNNSYNFYDNSAASAQGGAGIKAAQFVVDKNADAVITIRLGQNSADVLNGAKIPIYKSTALSASKNIDEFKLGNLSILTEIHQGFHHGGVR